MRQLRQLPSDARLASDSRSFFRLARARLLPVGRGELAVTLRADDSRFDVVLRSNSSDAIVMTETFVGRYHLPPVPLTELRTVVDLGANIGLTLAHLAALCPAAQLVGVELDRENVALARRNIARWSDRCSVISGAVWIRDETLRYRIAQGDECGAALAATGDLEADGVALDTLLAKLGWSGVDYVKMDIEGAERDVLRTNTAWASLVRSIKVETHGGYRREDCAADLERLGFKTTVDSRHPSAVAGVRR